MKKFKLIVAIFVTASAVFAFDSQELAMIDKIRKVCVVELNYKLCAEHNANGLYDFTTKTITLKDKMTEQYKNHAKQSIIHEFTHFICWEILPKDIVKITSKNKEYMDREIYIYQEVVADSISVICAKQLFGGDYANSPYIEIIGKEEFLAIAKEYAVIINTFSFAITKYLQEDL